MTLRAGLAESKDPYYRQALAKALTTEKSAHDKAAIERHLKK